MANLSRTLCRGTIAKVMPSAMPAGEETAEVAEIIVHEAEPLYREIRIVNSFADRGGARLKLRPGMRVLITIEVEAEQMAGCSEENAASRAVRRAS